MTDKDGSWRLVCYSGIPEGNSIVRFDPPEKVVSLSGDGVHLQALSDSGIFYRATNLRNDIDWSFTWTDKWGWPSADGPGLRTSFDSDVLWDVADSHPFDVEFYEDGNNKRHHIGFGVAHMYVLNPEGNKIFFNDWWLPADFSRQICGPRRGTYKAINISTSASTLFLINEQGEMYTKMHDFDIAGENPLLTYTFVQSNNTGTLRKIPMPDWQRQPLIDGSITSKITIFQNGKGNAARTLRVEGQKDDVNGYFYKEIFDEQWNFQETGEEILEPFLEQQWAEESTDPSNLDDVLMSGTLTKEGVESPLLVELLNFHLMCSPANLRILVNGEPLMVNGSELLFTFHHVHTLVEEIRSIALFWSTTKQKIFS